MTHALGRPDARLSLARALAGRHWGLAGLAAAIGVAAILMPQREIGLGLLTAASVCAALAVLSALLARAVPQPAVDGALHRHFEADTDPVLATDATGALVYRNPAARHRFGPVAGQGTIADLLRAEAGAAPDLCARLLAEVARGQTGAAVLPARRGGVQIDAHPAGDGLVLWRLRGVDARRPGVAALTGPGAPVAAPPADAGMPVLTVSGSGTILFLNPAMRRLLGGRPAQLSDVLGPVPPRDGELRQVNTAIGPREMRVDLGQERGGRLDLRLVPSDDPAAVPPPPVAAGFEDLPVALVLIGPDDEVLRSNRMARDLLDDAMVGHVRFEQLVTGLGRPVADWVADARLGRVLRKPEVMRARRGQRETFVQVTLDAGPDPGTLYAVLQDATALKTLEAQFVQSQKMQAVGQLAGEIAHDFNNLLTAISGHCDLLLIRRDSDDPDFADLRQIAQNANRAAGLVSQLLAFSRKQTQQPEILDLGETIAEAGHLLGRLVGERITLSLEHDPGLHAVRADRRQIEQVLMNLVVNARDAMPEGGSVLLRAANCSLRDPIERDRATVPAGDYVCLSVCDTGPGLPGHLIDRVFEPFFTTKRPGEGTGLGLSTVYGIVKQSGGFIFAGNRDEGGAEFLVLLPARPEATATAAADCPALPPVGKAEGVVLLVEDEASVRAFAARALRLQGYTVIEAASGEEALTCLADESRPVDVFVTDVIMPGLDGPGWVRQALPDHPEARVVFVSGYAEDALEQDTDLMARAIFLPKPFSLGDLAAAVRTQLGRA